MDKDRTSKDKRKDKIEVIENDESSEDPYTDDEYSEDGLKSDEFIWIDSYSEDSYVSSD